MLHTGMKYFLIVISVFITILSSSYHKAEALQPSWITDKQTGCQVWNPNPQPNESVSWSGECVDGKAHGKGVLTLFQNGTRTWQSEYSGENGALMEKGHGVVVTDISAVVFSLIKCSKSISYRAAKGDVKEEIDLSNSMVAKHILEEGGHFAQKKCPKKQPARNIKVILYQNGKEIVRGRNYDDNKFTWEEYSNEAYEEHARVEKEIRRQASKRLEAEEKTTKLAAQRAKEEMERNEAKKQLEKFISKNSVKEWPSMDELNANPFVFEGNIIALTATFSTMQTATQGVFEHSGGPFVVSIIPKGTFRGAKQSVVLAGKVIGKTELKVPLLGIMQVPHLEFVGVYFCKARDCSDIIRK